MRLHLREHRKRAGVTLVQAGAAVGVHASAVQKWERNVNAPTTRDLIRFAELYGIHPGAFFMAPDRSDVDERIDVLRVYGRLSDTHPAALLLAGEEPERRDQALRLTRCLTILERVPIEYAERWLAIGEAYPSGPGDRRPT